MTLKYLSMQVSIPAYSPLIDMVPSDPSTIMTAMIEARRITKNTGQSMTLFTADQQLYRVAVNVVWVYPELPMTLFSG